MAMAASPVALAEVIAPIVRVLVNAHRTGETVGEGRLSLAALKFDAGSGVWLPAAHGDDLPPASQDAAAPETLLLAEGRGPAPDPGPDPRAADMFALGVLTATLALGAPLCEGGLRRMAAVLGAPAVRDLWFLAPDVGRESADNLARYAHAPASTAPLTDALPAFLSGHCVEFLSDLLKWDPDARMSAAAALRHPFLRSRDLVDPVHARIALNPGHVLRSASPPAAPTSSPVETGDFLYRYEFHPDGVGYRVVAQAVPGTRADIGVATVRPPPPELPPPPPPPASHRGTLPTWSAGKPALASQRRTPRPKMASSATSPIPQPSDDDSLMSFGAPPSRRATASSLTAPTYSSLRRFGQKSRLRRHVVSRATSPIPAPLPAEAPGPPPAPDVFTFAGSDVDTVASSVSAPAKNGDRRRRRRRSPTRSPPAKPDWRPCGTSPSTKSRPVVSRGQHFSPSKPKSFADSLRRRTPSPTRQSPVARLKRSAKAARSPMPSTASSAPDVDVPTVSAGHVRVEVEPRPPPPPKFIQRPPSCTACAAHANGHKSRSPSPHRAPTRTSRSPSPRMRSKSPKARSKSPKARSKSPRTWSESPHTRSPSPHGLQAGSPSSDDGALQSPSPSSGSLQLAIVVEQLDLTEGAFVALNLGASARPQGKYPGPDPRDDVGVAVTCRLKPPYKRRRVTYKLASRRVYGGRKSTQGGAPTRKYWFNYTASLSVARQAARSWCRNAAMPLHVTGRLPGSDAAVVLGTAAVSLGALSRGVSSIDGWYDALDSAGHVVGYVKVAVSLQTQSASPGLVTWAPPSQPAPVPGAHAVPVADIHTTPMPGTRSWEPAALLPAGAPPPAVYDTPPPAVVRPAASPAPASPPQAAPPRDSQEAALARAARNRQAYLASRLARSRSRSRSPSRAARSPEKRPPWRATTRTPSHSSYVSPSLDTSDWVDAAPHGATGALDLSPLEHRVKEQRRLADQMKALLL